MKIRKIKLENNPFFGNIEFDFVYVNGKVRFMMLQSIENHLAMEIHGIKHYLHI